MKKVLFLIHDLGPGGAEKVLVNLVNNMDKSKFDITLMTLFDVGVNKQDIAPHIKYKSVFKHMFRGNSHLMKLLTPKQLHRWLIKENYDVEVAYLEGPCARIISGCQNSNTNIYAWIHIEQHTTKRVAASFRNMRETTKCYNTFNEIVCVSETVKKDFTSLIAVKCPVKVLYNTNESAKILQFANEPVSEVDMRKDIIKLVGVGKLLTSKGFDRIVRITEKLCKDGYRIHTYILGIGPEDKNLRKYIKEHSLSNNISLLGYQVNPYKFVACCDLFVCASYAEGFSTATTEALIVGTPVCTVEVSGMKEMLGESEYGVITENNEEALYYGIKSLLDSPKLLEFYKNQAKSRGRVFSTENTVKAVEDMIL